MKYVLDDEEYNKLKNAKQNLSRAYTDGFNDMWNIIKSQIDRYYYLNGESDNGIIVTLDAIKDRYNLNYNECYHDPKIYH